MKKIYKNLKNIIEKEEAFYSSIQEIDGYSIESFSYRLANNSMFEQDFAKEMRGIAFIYGKEITEPQLFTLGFHKFFNYGEGNTIDEIKGKQIESIQDKVDGSLIMFGKLPNGKIIAKSKTSISSDVATFANKILNSDKILYNFIEKYLDLGLFPIFEYVGPDNRIVVSYEKSELIFLGIREENGKYLNIIEVENIIKTEISHISISKYYKNLTFLEVLEKQKTDKLYEGFIINFTDGYKLKVKLESYVIKHNAKNDINSPKKLIEICLEDETDDLKSLFIGDKIALKLISDTEKKVFDFYNKTIEETEKLFQENLELINKFNSDISETEKREIRKNLAINNKNNKYFGLLMRKLGNRDIDYKEFVRGNIEI